MIWGGGFSLTELCIREILGGGSSLPSSGVAEIQKVHGWSYSGLPRACPGCPMD